MEILCNPLWKTRQKLLEICVDAVPRIADNRLTRMLIYLAGSIEYSPDKGRGWRLLIAPMLRDLGHEVYDPAEDELKNLTEAEVREFRGWKQTDLTRFRQTVQKIIAYDLDLIQHQADAIVCFWDEHAGRGAGTQGELTFAHRLGVPVYLICGIPVEQVSGWLLACATEIFTSFEAFHEFAAARLRSNDRMVDVAAAAEP